MFCGCFLGGPPVGPLGVLLVVEDFLGWLFRTICLFNGKKVLPKKYS